MGLQEVRFVGDKNQAQQIADDLVDIGYNVAFCEVHPETEGKNEGIAIITRFKILSTGSVSLKGGSPRNRRIFYARIQLPVIGELLFFVTHLTYEESKQCAQMMNVINYLDTFDDNTIQIVVGDLNTYFDFEWPIDLATRPINDFSFHKYNPCSQVAKSAFNGATSTAKFRDVWEDVYPDLSRFPGSTFPNFQDQRAAHLDPCRPDRILVRRNVAAENLITCDTYLFGQEMFDWSGKDGGGIPRRGMKMSDHKGVMTQLVWQPEEGRTYQQKEASVRNWLHAIQRPAPLAVPASPERYVDLHRSKVPQLRLPAKVESTMPHYLSFSADFAFDGNSETFFWSNRAPTDADTFTVILTEPKIARRISIITGVQQMKQRDMVFHGILQAYLPPSPSSSSSSSCNDPLLLIGGGQGLQPGARIETSGTATLVFNKAEPVHCIKLQITEPQENWVAIAEIVILE
mmetsp:Transcript_8428/g.13700  ORF Transcript_8428/g.13700 Transcript_8428/m.13700 type:complete len:459 (-) Transcript_8428:253-1629(-)